MNQQRVKEPQQLNKEARHHHLDQAAAVLADGRDKPAQAKARLGGAGVGLQIEQRKRFPLALAQELVAGDPLLTAQGIAHQQLAALLLPEDDGMAIEDAEGR